MPLPPRPYALLEYLVRRDGQLIPKDQLREAVWPGEAISDQNLTQQIYLLRSALAGASQGSAFIVTEPGRGYRFAGNVGVERESGLPETEAQRLYLRGRFHWEHRDAGGFARARQSFERALQLEPPNVAAAAGLAEVALLEGEYLLRAPHDAFPAARELATRALVLDPRCAEAHAVLGEVALYFDRDFTTAAAHYARGLQNDSSSPTILLYRCWYYNLAGATARAWDDVRQGLARAPYDLGLLTAAAICSLFERDYSRALEQLDLVLELNPEYAHARYYRAFALSLAGRGAEAVALIGASGEQRDVALTAYISACAGNADEVSAAEARLDDLEASTYVSAFSRALPVVARGDVAGAAAILRNGATARDPWVIFALHHPVFDRVRQHSAFAALVGELAPS